MRPWVAVCLLVAGCEGQIGTGRDPGEAGPREVEVPSALPRLETRVQCRPLLAGERALGSSPEGALWLARTSTISASATSIRVLLPGGLDAPQQFELRLTAIDDAVIHGVDRASLVADGAPWLVRDRARVTVSAPFTAGAGARICGDLSGDGFVFHDGAVHQRDGDAWLAWAGVAAIGAGARPVDRDGTCWSDSNRVLVAGADGALWALTPSTLSALAPMAGRVVGLNGEPIAGELETLTYQTTAYRLGGRTVDDLAAAGGFAWIRSGGEVLRFDGEGFAVAAEAIPASTLLPIAAGGVWAVADREACLVDPGRIEVEGLPAGGRTNEGRLPIRARTPDAGRPVRLSVDGVELPPLGVEGRWFSFDLELEVGRSEVELVAATETGQRVARTVSIGRTPATIRSWEADVRPIYEVHCADASCHVEGSQTGAPDLSHLEAWVLRADAIERRVLDLGDMPPTASRRPDWGEIEITTIREWLGGGLRP